MDLSDVASDYRYSSANKDFTFTPKYSPVDVKTEFRVIIETYYLVISLHCRQLFPAQMVQRILCINVRSSYNPHNRNGFPQMIIGQIVTCCSCYYLDSYYIAELLDYRITDQISDLMPRSILASVMGAGVCALCYVPFSTELSWIAQIITGGVLYVSLCRVLHLPSFMEVVEMAKSELMTRRRAD